MSWTCTDEAALVVSCGESAPGERGYLGTDCCFTASVTVMVHSHVRTILSQDCKTGGAVRFLMHVLCVRC